MSKPKVIVTRRWPEQVETRLAEVFDVRLNESDRPMSQDELRAAFAQADAVFPTVSDRIDADVLGAEPLKAKLCGNFGVGFNNIDVGAAKARGIAFTNVGAARRAASPSPTRPACSPTRPPISP